MPWQTVPFIILAVIVMGLVRNFGGSESLGAYVSLMVTGASLILWRLKMVLK